MRFATLATVFACLLAACSPLRAEPVEAAGDSDSEQNRVESAGRIASVTVYRGQALVTRLVELSGPAGLKEVVVTGLPEALLPGSIFAESADGLEVRSVRYRVRPVGEDVREEVRELETQIEQVQSEIAANARYLKLTGEHKSYLDSLQNFVAPTAQAELTEGVLNAETLQTLTEFLYSKRSGLAEEELKLNGEKEELQEKLDLLQRKRQTVASGSSKTVREAVVFVNVTGEGGGRLRLRYLVSNASWSPSYNVRTGAEREDVLVEYNAAVQQTTGEDWKDVEMTLSTATPSLVATAPELASLPVTLTRSTPQVQSKSDASAVPMDYYKTRKELSRRLEQFEEQRAKSGQADPFAPKRDMREYDSDGAVGPVYSEDTLDAQQGQGMGGLGGSMGRGTGQRAGGAPMAQRRRQSDLNLNSIAGEIQILDLKAEEKSISQSGKKTKIAEEGVSVTYTLDSAISMPSRSDRQLIQIAASSMKGDFQKIAVPVLTEHVYEQAEVTNGGELVLLAGPTSSFVDGRFVGHGSLPTVTVGEEFTVGFGIDSSLRADRELVEKTEETQGGNRLVDFSYRLSIENFGSEPATVRLMERIPTSKEGEIAVTLVSPGQDLSSDPAYEQDERKKGILRWQVEVPGEATGAEAFELDYEFRLEYDRQMNITGL